MSGLAHTSVWSGGREIGSAGRWSAGRTGRGLSTLNGRSRGAGDGRISNVTDWTSDTRCVLLDDGRKCGVWPGRFVGFVTVVLEARV